jgi:hypothetical protein
MKNASARALATISLSGFSLELSARDHSLFELTQVAATLQPGSSLKVLDSAFLSPLERACIMTAATNKVSFDSSAESDHQC